MLKVDSAASSQGRPREVPLASLGLRQGCGFKLFFSYLEVGECCCFYLNVSADPLTSERNYPASGISKYIF